LQEIQHLAWYDEYKHFVNGEQQMETSFWVDLWREGRSGFHQAIVQESLERFWPALPVGSSVLVPLCGKSLDMLWLEQQGLEVTGVELAEQAAEEFCAENELAFSVANDDDRKVYRLLEKNIRIIIDDFFGFAETYDNNKFDSLYDRAALVALPEEIREDYVAACRKLLCDRPAGMLITLEYPQDLMQGPPFSVPVKELQRLWPGRLSCLDCTEVLESLPKAKEAGISELKEYSWLLR
jgi:thiopurine S-methyltransferase